MGNSSTFLVVYIRSSVCDVICILIGKSVHLVCCPCINRLSRMAPKMICWSLLFWFLIRNNMVSNWTDGCFYCSGFVRKESSFWEVWLIMARVFIGHNFASSTATSLFCRIACCAMLWFEFVFPDVISFNLSYFMGNCLYNEYSLEVLLSSFCWQFYYGRVFQGYLGLNLLVAILFLLPKSMLTDSRGYGTCFYWLFFGLLYVK